MIRNQSSRVNQVLPDDFAFSRASTGYNTKGKLYMPNQMRLESSIYGGAVALVEEGTGNLISSQDLTTGWSYPNFTKTALGDGWYRFTCTSDLVGRGVVFNLTSSANSYTFSVELRNNAQPVRLRLVSTSDSTPDVVKTISANSMGRQFITGTQDDASDAMSVILYINDSLGNSNGMYFDIRFPQLEAKPYPTSWTDGTRAVESLTMPVLATNLLTANQASVESGTTGFYSRKGTETLTRSTSEKYHGDASLQVTLPGTQAGEGVLTTAISGLVAGYVYSAQVRVKATSGKQLLFQLSDTVDRSKVTNFTGTGDWQLVKVENFIMDSHISSVKLCVRNADEITEASTFYIDCLQPEPGPYATTWNLPTGATTPRMGLPVEHGTIEGIVWIDDITKRQDGTNYSRIFDTAVGSDLIRVFHYRDSARWGWNFGNNSGTSGTSFSDSLTPNGCYYYKIRWNISEVACEFWNILTKTKVVSEITSSPNLPSVFGPYIYIGSCNGTSNFINTRFGKQKLSNIAITADPDFDNLMPRDSNTVALMDFDDIQYRAVQNLVI